MKWVESKALVLLGLLGLLIAGCTGAGDRAASSYRSVNPGVAFEMMADNPELVVLDLRSFAEYSGPTGHLERAVSTPVAELGSLWPVIDLSAEDTVLLYGGDGGEMQIEAARALIERGLRYVVQIEGGLEAWLADGFAVRVEDAPLSPRRPLSPE